MALRKLQTEIDKVLKKVAEGVEVFEEIFEKIQSSNNTAQKEKYETNLKVEIKKLQRYRDQIKTWIQASEIKDKTALIDNRKLIETQMERFKAVEKELKTKQFSKEGLNAATKVDPLEREKLELSDWISTVKDKLSTQIDALEAEAESLQAAAKKSRGKGKNERATQIEHHVERHKHHISQLDLIQRMLDNGKTSVEAVRGIQENVNYYVDSNQEDDFDEDEGIYDELNLEDAEEIFGIANNDDDESDEDEGSAKNEEPPPVVSPAKGPALKTPSLTPRQAPAVAVPAPPPPAPKEDVKAAKAATTTAAATAAPRQTPSRMTPDPAAPAAAPATVKYAAVLASSAHPPETQTTTRGSTPTPSPAQIASTTQPSLPEEKKATSKKEAQQAQVQQQGAASQAPQSAPAPTQQSAAPTPAADQGTSQSKSAPPATAQSSAAETQPQAKEETPTAAINNQLPPSVADLVSSFAIARDRSQKTKEDPSWLQAMLNNSAEFAPEPLDAERPKYYFPKNSYPTPSYYPQVPLPIFDNPGVYEEFDLDTLFFIFYYQPGTYQQYLAARELKRQSWRFHKRYLTWFQRHEEPKAITEEYEQGAYIYFDFEGSWCQRKKNDFRFDYRWLEDEVF